MFKRFSYLYCVDSPTEKSSKISRMNVCLYSRDGPTVIFINHFINNTRTTVNEKLLLPPDIHKSYITIQFWLTFSYHIKHKPQPLNSKVCVPSFWYYGDRKSNRNCVFVGKCCLQLLKRRSHIFKITGIWNFSLQWKYIWPKTSNLIHLILPNPSEKSTGWTLSWQMSSIE